MMNLSLFEFLRENNSIVSEQVPDGNELLQFSSANHRQSRCDNRGFDSVFNGVGVQKQFESFQILFLWRV